MMERYNEESTPDDLSQHGPSLLRLEGATREGLDLYKSSDKDPCGLDSNCITRALLMELLGTGGQTNSHQGLGSGRASRDRVREVTNNEELPRRIKQKDENYYFLTVDSELTIDTRPKGNLAWFINYSCESNCETLL
ncbi:histone-lysine N-methyltransferase NSD2-like [Culex pipiens pallens]|uniref:histone-lysine N-methyltransferase NSD2-like n=1 Tax=Culex pipiens pallens TaxID=42434 RepID=UPI001954F40C|nr:histone-lysine N-methyltransferase NSD2-like [Culex pipiens pallens]